MISYILWTAAGIAVAWLLNKRFADRVKNKGSKLFLKAFAYIVFVSLGLLFAFVNSLESMLDKFIDGQINTIEVTLNKHFPGTKIMELSVNTKEFVDVSSQLKQSLNDIGGDDGGFFKKLIFEAFMKKLNSYVDGGINIATAAGNEQGDVTLKTILFNIKKLSLRALSPYFFWLNVLIAVAFLIFAGIYIGIAASLKKVSAGDNQSKALENVEPSVAEASKNLSDDGAGNS
jgi:hypothetical protein